jgi:hypothetical protein
MHPGLPGRRTSPCRGTQPAEGAIVREEPHCAGRHHPAHACADVCHGTYTMFPVTPLPTVKNQLWPGYRARRQPGISLASNGAMPFGYRTLQSVASSTGEGPPTGPPLLAGWRPSDQIANKTRHDLEARAIVTCATSANARHRQCGGPHSAEAVGGALRRRGRQAMRPTPANG